MRTIFILAILFAITPTLLAQEARHQVSAGQEVQGEKKERSESGRKTDSRECSAHNKIMLEPGLPTPKGKTEEKDRAKADDRGGVKNPRNYDGWDSLWKKPAAVFTGSLAILTLMLVLTGFYQAWLSRDVARRQLRAYVNVSGIVINQKAADPILFEIRLTNVGTTPAYGLHGWEVVEVKSHSAPEHSFYTPVRQGPMSRTVVGPGTSVHRLAALPAEKVEGPHGPAFRRGEIAIYVWGEYRYRDAFGRTRWTKFRAFCAFDDLLRGQTADCESGNDAT